MKTVLVLPGGGIRGYVQARALRDIEYRSGYAAHDLFDLIVGTSTGGILACALGLGVPAQEVVTMYREQGPSIFHRPWWSRVINPRGLRAPKYGAGGLSAALSSVLGDKQFGMSLVPLLVTTRNFTQRREVLLKSWQFPDIEIPMRDVCLATSAAPTFFPPHRMDGDLYIDGGMFANNPVAIAAAEALHWFEEPFQVLVIKNGVDMGINEGDGALGWGLIRWAPSVAGEFMDAGSDVATYLGTLIADGRVVTLHPGPIAVNMDDASEEAFDAMDVGYRAHMLPDIEAVVRAVVD